LQKARNSDRVRHLSALAILVLALGVATDAKAGPEDWRREWPHTDFSRHFVDYREIFSGGPPKDGIPAIALRLPSMPFIRTHCYILNERSVRASSREEDHHVAT
jgi:hypothetical protein